MFPITVLNRRFHDVGGCPIRQHHEPKAKISCFGISLELQLKATREPPRRFRLFWLSMQPSNLRSSIW